MPKFLNIINTRLVEPARWLVVGCIAYTLATSALYFISPPQSDVGTVGKPASASGRPTATTSTAGNIDDVVSRNLFGVADANAQPLQNRVTAVETRLPLELQGVFVAEVVSDSAAIVAQKGKPGVLYNIGEMLPGNAELLEVHPNHIVLRRAGSKETLTFPEVSAQLVADVGSNPLTINSNVPGNVSDRSGIANRSSRNLTGRRRSSGETPPTNPRDIVSNYRERIDSDPKAALSDLGVTPVTDGASSGYRLGNLADSPYLSQTGLQPGDVIVSVNGRPVGDISQDRMEIDNVLAQGSARLEVKRGTRRFFVTASLP
jgi:general secretion pathway protein C